jgi:hypothetical protein
VYPVSDNLFHVLGVPIVAGRSFQPTDRQSGEPVVVVNAQAKRVWFGDTDPIGRRIQIHRGDSVGPWLRVVGVAGNTAPLEITARISKVSNQGPSVSPPLLFVPLAQARLGQGANHIGLPMYVAVRAANDRAQRARALAAAITRAAPDLDPPVVMSMSNVLDGGWVEQPVHLNGEVAAAVALITLLLAVIGIGGIMAEFVRHRMREFGVRLALGASTGSIVRLVCANAAKLLLLGVVVGGTASWWGATFIAKVAFGGTPPGRAAGFLIFGPTSAAGAFLGVAAAILCAGLIAAFIPARRAGALDPVAVLRAGTE